MLKLLEKTDQDILDILRGDNFTNLPLKLANRQRLLNLLREYGCLHRSDHILKSLLAVRKQLLRDLQATSKERQRHSAYLRN